MRRIGILLLVVLIALSGIASASIRRETYPKDSRSYAYFVENSHGVNGHYVLNRCTFWYYYGRNNSGASIAFLTTDHKNMQMSSSQNIVVHVGSLNYELENDGYEANTRQGACYKSGDLPKFIADSIHDNLGRQAIWFTVPLSNGSSFEYVPTAEDWLEWNQTYIAYLNELNG